MKASKRQEKNINTGRGGCSVIRRSGSTEEGRIDVQGQSQSYERLEVVRVDQAVAASHHGSLVFVLFEKDQRQPLHEVGKR